MENWLKNQHSSASTTKNLHLQLQHKLGQRHQSLQLFTEVNFVLSVLVFRIRTGASLVTPINSDMLTIPSLIWTVQPGLKHENPSAISLMVCEPADPGAAERSPPWWSSDVIEVLSLRAEQPWWLTTTPEAPLFLFFSPNTLQTAKPVTVRHQGSVVCQHLPADKDREGKILSPGERIAPSAECVFERESVCERIQSEYLCVFSQWQQPNRKHSCGEEDGASTLEPPAASLPARRWKVTIESSDK